MNKRTAGARLAGAALLMCQCAFGAIGYDTSVDQPVGTAATSTSFAVTVGNNPDRLMLLGCGYDGLSQSVSTSSPPTYAGAAFTHIRRSNDGTHGITTDTWYLVAPAVGAANLAVTMAASTTFWCNAKVLYNVSQSAPIDAAPAAHVVSGTTTANSASITTVAPGAWIADWIVSGTVPSAVSGQTNVRTGTYRTQTAFGSSASGPISPAGATAQNWTYASTTTASNLALVSVAPDSPTLTSISPANGAAGANTAVTLTGSNFASGATVNAGTGITVSNLNVVSATQITATFAIAANAAIGPANVTVTTQGGTTSAVTFTINSVGSIGLDTSVDQPVSTAAASTTFPVTVDTNSNRLILLGCAYDGLSQSVSTTSPPTYSGSAFTHIARNNDGTHGITTDTWYLVAPPVGTANLIVTMAVSTTFWCDARVFYNASQTAPIDATAWQLVSGTTTGNSASLTTVASGAWIVDWIYAGKLPSAASGQTYVNTGNLTSSSAFGSSASGPVSPAGAAAQNWTYASTTTPSNLALVSVAPAPPIFVTVAPTSSTLYAGQTQQFTASVGNTINTAVLWSIAPLGTGTITAGGLYTAPATISSTQPVTVTATSVADGTKSAAATVTLMPPISVSVAPPTATLYGGQTQQFTATVTNAGNTAVTWSVAPTGTGTIDPNSGLYTAPASIATQQTVTVTAKSQADNSTVGTAIITLSPPISVTVSPTTVTLNGGQTQTFTALLANTTNQVVTWSSAPTGIGSIDPASGIYTAPAAISTQQSVTITATSHADNSKIGTATITLNPTILYSHRRAITFDHTKLYSDQINFPVLVSGTYSYLATTANGGQVQNPNGYDIIFTSDFAGATKLDHEIESYDPVTGTIRMWVRIPVLSSICDTTIYLTYGNAAVTASQENKSGVWDSNFKSVLHMGETGGATLFDSTANGNNGLKVSASSPAAIAGEIGGAQSFNGTSDFVTLPASMTSGQSVFSVSFWTKTPDTVYGNTPQTSPHFVGDETSASTGNFGLVDAFSNTLVLWMNLNSGGPSAVSAGGGDFGPIISDNNWHHVEVVNDGSNIFMYVDGTGWGRLPSGLPLDTYGWYLGAQHSPNGGPAYFLQGTIDEFRFSNSARNNDWVVAEYANQSSPATFYSISAENAIGVNVCPPGVILTGGQTQQFTANVSNAANTSVTWSLAAGNAGAINSTTGLYTAPATIAAQQDVTVIATSQADATATGSTSLTLWPPMSVFVTGNNYMYAGQTQYFYAGIQYNTFNDYTVTWSISPSSGAGTIDPNSGFYTAPASVAAIQTVSIIATSKADPTKSGTLVVTLYPPLNITVAPSTVNMTAEQAQQFTATVTNGPTSAVTWSVNPVGMGGIAVTGIYTAPATISSQQTVTIKAVSQVDNVTAATATVTLFPPAVTISPGTISLTSGQTQQFTAAAPGNAAVTWSLPAGAPGQISAAGLYTAPTSITTQQTVDIIATSQADSTKIGIATVTLYGSGTYGHHRAITISHTQVPNTDQVNFPVLISGVFNFLATTANGGQAQNANGYDIIFTSDLAGTAKLDHEIDSYDPVTGTLKMWVRIPLLSHTCDTVIYVFYGNPGIITSQENKSGVWDANYKSVLHMGEAVGTTLFDSTTNGNNAVKVSASSPATVPGRFGGAQSFNGTSDFVTLPPVMTSGLTSFTVSFWTQGFTYTQTGGALPTNPHFLGDSSPGTSSGDFGLVLDVQSLGMWSGLNSSGDNSLVDNFGALVTDGSAHYVVAVNNGSSIRVYVDGRDSGLTLASGLPLDNYGWYLGAQHNQGGGASYYLQTTMDEFRFSNSARSADWIKTETNNQRSPASFFTVSDEGVVGISICPGPVDLYGGQTQQFTTNFFNGPNSAVTWSIPAGSPGTIDANTGIYTAPATIANSRQVEIIATSVADGTTTGGTTVNLFPPISVTVYAIYGPSLGSGALALYTANVNNSSNQNVTWSISPAGLGSIDPTTGIYSAPALIPVTQTVTVTATSQADPTKSGSVNTFLTAPSILAQPYTSTLYGGQSEQFSASVTNSPNLAVTWSTTGPGTIDPNTGFYTAPATITTQQTVTVTATSQFISSITGSATITLMPPVSVTLTPTTVSLVNGQAQQFTATVANALNPAVTWSVNPPSAGSVNASGLYLAPVTAVFVPVTVTATSVFDSTKSASATLTIAPPVGSGYSYRRAIVIDHTKVPNTDQTDFPVLISGTYGYLAGAANGGKVQSPNGYDIIFSSDCAGAQKLDHEIESYRATDGTIAMWVRLPLVSHTVDTVFYMSYGNAAVTTTQENKTGVWRSNYQMVLHLDESAAPYVDSTANAYQSIAATAPAPGAGKIGAGQTFDGASQYIAYSGTRSPNPSGAISMEAWIKTANSGPQGVFGKWSNDGTASSDDSYQVVFRTGGVPGGQLSSTTGTPFEVDAGTAIADGNWHHVVVTGSAAGALSIYVDGAPGGTVNSGAALLAAAPDRLLVGASGLASGNAYLAGSLDEIRISNAVRTPDWIATEFSNQNAPATFYTIYPENANAIAPSAVTLTSFQTQQFQAVFTVSPGASVANPLVLLGQAATPSSAESIVVNGNLAYLCDDNEISVMDVSNPGNPRLLTTVTAPSILDSSLNHCSVQQNSLVSFADASASGIPGSPYFTAFGLTSPTQPTVIAATPINRRFFSDPSYLGDIAYMPTGAYDYFVGSLDGAQGQVVSIDISNLAAPLIKGFLLSPDDGKAGPGNGFIFGATLGPNLSGQQLLYVSGSTATDGFFNANNGTGKLLVSDVTDPTNMSVLKEVDIPGTVDLYPIKIQGNIAVALGDNGGTPGSYPGVGQPISTGNIVVTTFDLTDPRNPVILNSKTTTYIPGVGGSAVQLANNLFLFAGVRDSSNNDVLLLVDITNPASPVLRSFLVGSPITYMQVVGNVLHTSTVGGYAAYQIPAGGVTQSILGGSCGGPVTWTLNPPTTGTLTSTGLYTAPASITTQQSVIVSAASQSNPTQTASATITLSPSLVLTLNSVAPGPYVSGHAAAFLATVISGTGTPVPGITLSFTAAGANTASAGAVTDAAGHATFIYTGANRGSDTVQAATTANGGFSSSGLTVSWISPANPISTTSITGRFFAASSCPTGCEAFTTPVSAQPVFTQNFPNLMFDPYPEMLASNSTGVSNVTRPFTDVVLDASGASAGTSVAQGANQQAGVGTLAGFATVLRGNFVVAQAGTYTLNIGSADGFLFGVGGGAVRVSGINVNPPPSGVSPFYQFPVMAANNTVSTGAPVPVAVSFPAAGTYPYEFDYRSGTGGPLALAVTVNQNSTAIGLRPLDSLLITYTGSGSAHVGQPASFKLVAKDETGAPLAQLPVTVTVAGVNPQTTLVTTDATGSATFTYTGSSGGVDVVQATATVSGQTVVSNQPGLTWATTQAPLISVTGDQQLTLPNTGTYTATVTDPAAPSGGPISVSWSQVSGPATVTFDTPTQLTTHALFTAPGTYVLQVTATDLLGTSSVPLTNIVVLASPTADQGWIGTPLDHSQVTGVVPITVAPGVTLQSGTLTYYPVANPNAVVTLSSNTTGSATIGTFDTTTLQNGTYYVLLNATDSTGKTMGSGIWLVVGGDYKPGRVTTTVTDLVVPAPGLPIRIDRTYDSLTRSTSGDFGFGWQLGINVQLEISNLSDVTLTLNGQRRTFYFTPSFSILDIGTPAYTPEPGFFGKLQATSDNCGGVLVKTGQVYICAVGFEPYTPLQFVYTDPYGRVYTIGGTGALQSVKDVAGNTLTITAAGITGSNGLSVPFVRDTQGRITQITDPLNQNYTYTYDANGNLASVTYPATPPDTNPVAQYTYDATHLYTGGTDPRNNPLPVTTYDSAGRLQTVTTKPDAATSYTTTYAYATTTPVTVTYPDNTTVTGFTTTITNPDATTSTQVYDTYGKLISATDPLGHTTLSRYDSGHNLIAVTDPLGHTTTYTYDSNGNRTSVTYPTTATSMNTTSTTVYNANSEPIQTTDELYNVRKFSYDANFWPTLAQDTSATSPGPIVSFTFNANGTMAAKTVGYDLTQTSGVATTYTYDQYGNLASQTDALSRQTTYQYDTLGRKTSMTSPGGGTTGYAYDALGNLKTLSEPLSRTTSYAYDTNGNKTSETDPNGNVTCYQYDALNRLIETDSLPAAGACPVGPAGSSIPNIQNTYDFRNNVVDTTDEAGHVTHNVYDMAGRLTSVTKGYGTADAATTSYTYDADGRKQTETDPLNNVTTYNYDDAGRLTSVVDARNQTTKYAYDDAGNQISALDPNLHKTQSQYDARRRLAKTTYDDGTATQYGYDGPGNLTSVTDQASNVVQYTYDAANQLKTVVQTASPSPQNTTAYNYDANGNLTNLTDANSHTTQNGFDVLNQLTSETLPAGPPTQTRTYDPAGNLLSLTDYNGKKTTYTYDTLNRLLTKTPDPSLNEPTVSFTYTPTGKRATMTDASGTTTYTYDNLDRLKTKATPEGTLSYSYDAAGNVASIQSSNANGTSVSYTYDNLNRLATVVDNRLPVNQNTTQYSYDPASNLATVTYPNGLQSTFTYNDLDRVTALGATRTSYNYTLSPTGNRDSATESSGRAVNWTYDGIYRLSTETISLDPHSKNGTVSYGLDAVGNRISQTSTLPSIVSGAFSFDLNDRLSNEVYDNNGSVLTLGERTFSYNFENRLKSMNNGTVAIVYDGDGNRAGKTFGALTTRYLVDDLNPTGYLQVVEEVVGGSVARTYTYGRQRISQNQLSNAVWTPSFYAYDGFGSVRLLTDSAGTVTDTYDYDAWGNLLNTTGSTPNVYLYRGEQYDVDLALYYLRARYFDAVTGRFISADPAIGESTDPATLHRYFYSNADPINRADPWGSASVRDPVAQGSGAAFTPLAGGYLTLFASPLEWIRLHLDFRETVGKSNVQRCCRYVDLKGLEDRVAKFCGIRHCWLKTSTKAAGMEPVQEGDLPANPLGNAVMIKDESKEKNGQCTLVPDVDEKCVNDQLKIGKPLGRWYPWNQCNSFVDSIISKCRTTRPILPLWPH